MINTIFELHLWEMLSEGASRDCGKIAVYDNLQSALNAKARREKDNPQTIYHYMNKPTQCTCNISRTPCNSAFVYDESGATLAEIPIEHTPHLRTELTALCAGAALQKLNKEIKANARAN